MSLSAKPFVPVFFSASIQLFLFGCNTVLFAIAMRLLWKRRRLHPSIFHILSTIVLFVFATVVAVTLTLETSAMIGGWASVDLGACSLVLFVASDLVDMTGLIILVYRCYCVCHYSLKCVVLPSLLILIASVSYYSNMGEYIKGAFGANVVQVHAISHSANITSNIALVCSLIAHLILTLTISIRIWWFTRNARLMTTLPARSGRYYSYNIAVVLESGLIMPIFHTIFTGFMLDGSEKWTVVLSIMGGMLPQIATLAPLLIVVRIGLGQAIEENTSHLSRSRMTGISNSHQTNPGSEYPYVPTFRATTTHNEQPVGEVITIGYTGPSSDHDLHDKFEAGP
ncbi:hypothetical protein V5O48_016230 [Marasmius crinis-equi]|uniref:Integral membrane protein n=1 Tax=Marasmius crinis-equi TaxID=585013 RepID=A0ABR3ES90_9AGAR